MLLSGNFLEPAFQETLGLMVVLLRGFQFFIGAYMPSNFALLFAVSIVSNPKERAALALKNPALSASVHRVHSFPHNLKNSETLSPFALAFFSSWRYSSSDIRSSTLFVRGLPVFNGRPMRFFVFPTLTLLE